VWGNPRELVSVVHREAKKLVLGGSLKHHDLEIGILVYGPADELDLEAGLSLEVQDLLSLAAHVQDHMAGVVPLHLLTGLYRNAEADRVGSGVLHRKTESGDDRLSVAGQHHLGARQEMTCFFCDHGDLRSPEARMTHGHVGHERGALEHGARRLDPVDLNVGRQALRAEPHGEHRHARGLEGHERPRQRTVSVVGAVRDDHQRRERKARQLFPGQVQRAGQVGVGSLEGELVGSSEPGRGGGETKETEVEALAQRPEEVAVAGCEGRARNVAARSSLFGRQAHAARVVDEDAHEVAAGHDRAE